MRRIYNILMARSKPTYRLLGVEAKRKARAYLWQHAALIEQTHEVEEWVSTNQVYPPARDKRTGRFRRRR